MRDKNVASRTFLVDTWMLTYIHTSQSRCALGPEMNYKRTWDTHFQGIAENVCHFGRHCLLVYCYSAIHSGFYVSK